MIPMPLRRMLLKEVAHLVEDPPWGEVHPNVIYQMWLNGKPQGNGEL